MNHHADAPQRVFRVWVGRYENWTPRDHRDSPPHVIAVRPAEPEWMNRRAAGRYVEAFNHAALALGRRWWAVAVPVALHCVGDPRPGDVLVGSDRKRTTMRIKKVRHAPVRCRRETDFHRGNKI